MTTTELTGKSVVAAKGTFEQVNAADFFAHWEESLEAEHGISLESILNVNFVDIQERIDISMDGDGFHLDILPLGTNYLDYEITVVEGGAPVAANDLPFATRGTAGDLAYLDLLGDDYEAEDRTATIEYAGQFLAEEAGTYRFEIESVSGATFSVAAETVTVAPGETATVEVDLARAVFPIALTTTHGTDTRSGTRRTDDDLRVKVTLDGDSVDLFDHVRTTPENFFTGTVEFETFERDGYIVSGNTVLLQGTELGQTFDVFDREVSRLYEGGISAGDLEQVDVAFAGHVTIDEAGTYSFPGLPDGTDAFGPKIGNFILARRAADGAEAQFAEFHTLALNGAVAFSQVELTAGEYEIEYSFTVPEGDVLREAPFGFSWQGPDTGGHLRPLFETKPPAVTDALLQTLNDSLQEIGRTVSEVEELLVYLNPIPIKAIPTWDFSLGIDTELGWDIEIPKMGRTTTTQPISFDLIVDEAANRGDTITAQVTNVSFSQPHTRSHLLELGDIGFDAGFSLPETGLGGLGLFLGTKGLPPHLVDDIFGADSSLARLNHALDDLVGLQFTLGATFTLGEIVDLAGKAAGAAGVAYDPEKGLSFTEFLQGLYSGETSVTETLDEFTDFIREGDFVGAFNMMIRIAGLAPDEEEEDEDPDAPADPGYPIFDVTTTDGGRVQIPPHEVLGVARDAALAGTDDRRTVEVVDEALGKVSVHVQEVEDLLERTGISEVFSKISEVFQGGVELIPGLNVAVDVGIGETYEGWGWDAVRTQDADDTRDAVQPIVMHTTVDLLDVEVDLREVVFDGLSDALTGPLGNALAANPAGELARAAAAIVPTLLEKLEEGGSAELTVDHGQVIHEVVKIALDLVDSLVGRINQLIDRFVPGHFDALEINLSENELVEAAFDDPDKFQEKMEELLQPIKDTLNRGVEALDSFIKSVLGGLVSAGREVLDVIHAGQRHIHSIESRVEDMMDDALEALDIHIPLYKDPDTYLAEFLSKIGINTFESSSDEEILKVDRHSGLLGELHHFIDTPDALDPLLDKLDRLVRDFHLDLSGPIDSLIDSMVGFIPEMLEPIRASADLELDLFDLVAGMELDLTQTTTFTPQEIEVEYRFGDQVQRVALGEEVTFDVPDSGAGREVTATLIYDGAYDYAYELTPKFDIDMTVLGFSVDARLEHGDDILHDQVHEYALIETVEGEEGGALFELVGEAAVVELNKSAVEHELLSFFDEVIAAPIRDLIGVEDAALGAIPFGTVASFAPDANPEGQTFTTVTATALVEIGNTPVLTAEAGGAPVQGTDVDEILLGGRSGDTLLGGGGNDALVGGRGDDILVGGAGADTLEGGDGNDVLRGGGGNDRHVYSGVFGKDEVRDFTIGEDVIDFTGYAGRVRGGLSFDRLHLADEEHGVVIQADLNRDGAADRFDFNRDGERDVIEIHLTGVAAVDLSADDFLF